MEIKAVLFDIDQTLLYTERANIKFYQKIMQNLGYPKPPAAKIRPNLSITMKDLLVMLLHDKTDAEFERAYKYARSIPVYDYSALVMPKGEIRTLAQLSREYKMGVVTSRIKKGAIAALRSKKILKYFEDVVAFEDYSRPKPDPEPLLMCAKNLGVEPEDTVYVGDAASDLKAARSAGMEFIAYRTKLEGCRFRAMSYRQIPGILDVIGRNK